jgi:hypothetical protein
MDENRRAESQYNSTIIHRQPSHLVLRGQAAPAHQSCVYLSALGLDRSRSAVAVDFTIAQVAILIALIRLRHRTGRGTIAAVLLFCGTLVPALGFVNVYPMRFSFVADHFQYHASLYLIALCAAIIWRFIGRVAAVCRRRWR